VERELERLGRVIDGMEIKRMLMELVKGLREGEYADERGSVCRMGRDISRSGSDSKSSGIWNS
jgi:hypothetical protein